MGWFFSDKIILLEGIFFRTAYCAKYPSAIIPKIRVIRVLFLNGTRIKRMRLICADF